MAVVILEWWGIGFQLLVIPKPRYTALGTAKPSYCTTTVLLMYYCCTTAVLLCYYCTTTVLLLYYYCTTTVLLLYYYCTTVLVHYYCTITVLLLSYRTTTVLLNSTRPQISSIVEGTVSWREKSSKWKVFSGGSYLGVMGDWFPAFGHPQTPVHSSRYR